MCTPATNSLQGPWWILSWPEQGAGGGRECPPPPPPAYRVLTGWWTAFGRTLAFHRQLRVTRAGAVTGVTDGAGPPFSPALTTQAQRAEAFVKQRASSLSSRPVPVLFPLLRFSPTRCPPVQSTVPITVSGWRRYGSIHDPACRMNSRPAPLARYIVHGRW